MVESGRTTILDDWRIYLSLQGVGVDPGAAAVNLHAGSRLVSWRPEGTLPASTPQEVAMSPVLLIVFIPLFVGGVAFVALLFAAATADSREAFELRPQDGTTAAEEVLSRGTPSEPSSARAA